MQKAKRILAMLLVLTMILSLLPTAFAADGEEVEKVLTEEPAAAAASLEVSAALPTYKVEDYSYAERAVDLVSRMTLAEKASQTAGYDAPAIPRLGIATYMWWNEALHGYNQRGWFGMQTDGTSYPSSYSMGASFDKDLYYQEAVQIGAEIRERVDDNRYNLSMFSPNINLARDARWGRNDESYGEDPFLVGTMASQFVNGVEGKTQDGEYIKLNANGEGMKQAGTTIKHYAANNSEKNRYTSGADDVTIREMREYYTRAARIVVKNADVSSVMMAYSSVSGIPISFSSYYMDTILRQSYGFSGYIVSDCDSVATSFNRNVHKNNPHTGENYTKGQAYANALANGLDLQCNAGETDSLGSYSDNHLSMLGQATDKGTFTEAQFEVSAARLMYKRMQFGEFDADNYYADQGAARLAAGQAGEYVNGATGQTAERIALADETSRSTVVLLQNKDDALPVTAEEINAAEDKYDVAIFGSNAQSSFLGGYSSRMGTNGKKNVVTIESAIRTAFADAEFLGEDAAAKTEVSYFANGDNVPEDLDLAIVAIGEGQGDSREDGDRMNINMKAAQVTMFDQVVAANPKKIIVVMETYGAIQMPDTVLDNADAILWSGFNGIRKGTGFGEAITGKNNPSGRMNATWLKDAIGDTPDFFSYQIFPDEEGNGGRSYMYNVEETLWPFGYGLSYSDIEYAPVAGKASILGAAAKNGRSYSRITKDTVMDVTFQMTNTNGVAGKQVAEVYVVSPGAGTNNLPLKRLVGFDKVFVEANGTTEVSIPVNVTDFAFFNEDKDCYEIPTGEWQIWVAKSSEFNPETDLCETFTISNGNIVEEPIIVTVKPTMPGDAAKGIGERVIFPLSANAEDNIIYPNVGVTMANEKIYGTRIINNVPGKDIGVDAKAVRAYTLATEEGFTVPDTAKFVDRLEEGKLASELPMIGTKFALPADYIVTYASNRTSVVDVVGGQLVMKNPGVATITAKVTGPTGASAETEFAVCVTGEAAVESITVGGKEVQSFASDIYEYFVELPEGFEADDAAAFVQASAIEGAEISYSTDGVDFAAAEGINPAEVPGKVYIKVSGENVAAQVYVINFGDDGVCEHIWRTLETVDPTCLTDGYSSFVCTLCNKTKKDAVVAALGHTYENGRCIRCRVKDPEITARNESYILADTIEVGKQYVIVQKTADGDFAMVDGGATIYADPVTIAGDKITSIVFPDAIWTVSEGTSTHKYGYEGTGYFLSATSDGILARGSGTALGTAAYTAATLGTSKDYYAFWMLQDDVEGPALNLIAYNAGTTSAASSSTSVYTPHYNAASNKFEAASARKSAMADLLAQNALYLYEVCAPEYVLVDELEADQEYIVVSGDKYAMVNGDTIGAKVVEIVDGKVVSDVTADMLWNFAEGTSSRSGGREGFFLTCGDSGVLARGSGGGALNTKNPADKVTDYYAYWMVGDTTDGGMALYSGNMTSTWGGSAYILSCDGETFKGASQSTRTLQTGLDANPLKFYATGVCAHEYEETAIVEPTCLEGGYTVETCAICGKVKKTNKVAALGHEADPEVEAIVVPATCTAAGSITYTCVRCGELMAPQTIKALGHAWDEGDVTAEATEDEFGSIIYHCTNDGCEETKTVRIKPTSMEAGPVVVKDENSITGYTAKFIYYDATATSVTFKGDIGLKNDIDRTDKTNYTPFEYRPGLMRGCSFSAPMEELADGYWYYEVPLAGGANQYWFSVNNGSRMMPDPANMPEWSPRSNANSKNAYNILYVPYDEEKQAYEPVKLRAEAENPRDGGYLPISIEERKDDELCDKYQVGKWDYYQIEYSNGKTHWAGIYTPYGYDPDRAEPYKLIIAQHGSGQDESDWMGIGSVQNIMDNLAAEGRTEPAVIVSTTTDNNMLNNGDNYATLLTELLGWLEEHYNISDNYMDRAFCGLSMGGGQTISIINANPVDAEGNPMPKFGYYGPWSAGMGISTNAPAIDSAHILIGTGWNDTTVRPNDAQFPPLKEAGVLCDYKVVTGAHDFNAWNQLFRIFCEEYLWNPAAFGDGMNDIDFDVDVDAYEVAKKASAKVSDAGLTLPSSNARFENDNRADVVEIPVAGDNWTATVKFTCTRAGSAFGGSEYFAFLVGDSYSKALGLRGTTSSTKGYLNGADAGKSGSGFKANNVKYYRIQKVGDTFICSVSDNDFDYEVVYTVEDADIIGKKLFIDAYSTSSWSFGQASSYTLDSLSFADPCEHEVETEVVKPTCTEDGYTLYSCSICGKSYKGNIVPAQHKKWETDKGVVTAPTCTAAGYITYICAECGESFTEPGAAALGHDWVAGNVIAPTCTAGGYTEYSCSRCDATKQDSKTAATGHIWENGETTLEATETEFGEFVYTCSAEGCEATKTVKILPTALAELDLGPTVFADPESPTGYTVKFLYENKTAKSVTFAGDIALKNDVDLTDNKVYTPFEYKPGLMRSASFTAPMVECMDGIWYYEVPMAAGANQYWFYIDGNDKYMVPDPANAPYWSPNSASNKNAYNAVYIPYDEKQDYEPLKARVAENPKNGSSFLIPENYEDAAEYGMGTWSYVPVEITGKTQYIGVYLPYGYDAKRVKPYKLIYVLHGSGQDESDWMGIGSVQNILDNLIAEGRTEPAVLVSVSSNYFGNNFANLFNIIVPFVEENYNVTTNPMNRAFCGLSMGSMNTMSIINGGADRFGYYGAWSGGMNVQASAPGLAKTHIYFGSGWTDNTIRPNHTAYLPLKEAGFSVAYQAVTGAHDFNTWNQLFRMWVEDYLWNPAAFGEVAEYTLAKEVEEDMQYVVVADDKYAMTLSADGKVIGVTEVTVEDGKITSPVTKDMLWDFEAGVSTHAKGEPGYFLSCDESGVLARGSGGGALNVNNTIESLGTAHDYYGYWMVRDLGDSNFGLYAGNMASSWGASAYVLSCDGETFKGVSQSSRNLEAGLAANPLKFYATGVCEHDYQWTDEDVVAPTCLDEGYTVMTCSKCGKVKKGNKVAALGHDWIAGEVIAPTCTVGGYTEFACSRCDATKQDAKTAATGHSWNKGEVTLEATEDAFGEKVYTCTVDGCEGTKIVKILPTALAEGPTVVKDPESPTGYTVKFVYKNENAKSVTFAGDIGLKNDADLSDSKTYTPFEYKPGLMRSASFTDDMVECDGGYWFYELPLAGGANQYWFYVDGNTNYMVPDPVNAPYWSPNSAANKNAYNAVYVPYDAKQDYEPMKLRAEAENPKNGSNFLVPPNYEDAAKNKMGTWSYVNVPSLGENYYVGVYLPYGYDPDRAEPYKTIYICHGGGQDESDWVGIGSVQNIMDNLAAAGRTEPAVIIAPNINAININNYKPLLTDVIPFVEENYNVSTDKMDRAMAGLSMGGMATMSVINSDPKDEEGNPIEKFGYYGPWSGGNNVEAGFAGQEYAHILFAGGHSDFGNMSESSVTALADQGVYCKYVGVTGAHDFNTWCQMFRIWLEDYLWDPASVGDYRLIEEKLGEVPESIDDLQGKFPVIVEDPESPTGYTGKFVYYNPDILTAYFNGDIGLKQPEYTSKQTTVTPFEYESGMMRVDGFKDEMEYLGGGWWYYELPLAAGANQYWFTTNKNSSYMIPDPLNHPDWSPASNWNSKNAYNAIYVPYDAEKQNDEATGARAIENPRTGSCLNPTREERKDPALAERYQLGTWDYVPYSVGGKDFYMGVYLPYGYDAEREEPYKTVYVLHGGGQDESDWLGIGSVQNIIDNLAADGEIEDAPVLIVPGTGSNRLRNENLEATFAFVEENYNVSSDRMDRAICGLSMGAMQVNSIIGDDKKRDEPSFGYYGPFSGGAPSNALTSQYLYDMYIYIGNGTAESKMNMSQWENAHANYYYTQKSGAHNFNSWNQLFTEFVRDFAFQPSKFLKAGPVVYKDAESPTGYTGRFVYYNPEATEVTFAGDIGLRNYADPDDATQYTPFDYVPDGMYDFDGDGVETPVCMMRSGAFTAPMENLGDGYWVYELPLAAGANQYWFYVDGDTNWMRADPANAPIWSPNSPANKNAYNAVYVPYDEKQGNELMKARTAELPRTDGQTGTWSYVEFKEGEYIGVYLPYGYDPDRAEPYKTIYMQHGGGQDESDWMGIGSVQKIMDNLAAEGRTEPAIIITPDSNDLGWAMWGSGSTFTGLYDEIIPFVEENYNVSTEKKDRAFAGLSMGSMVAQSLINFDASQFGYFGPWSGGASISAASPNLQHTHVLLAGGRYDFGNPGSRTADALAADGFFVKYIEVAGAHDFNTWCQLFRIFCEDYLWNDEAFGDTLYDDMEYVRDAMEAARAAEKAAETAQAAAEAAQAAAEAAAAEAAEDKAAAEAAQAAAEAAQAAAEAAQAKAEAAQAAAEAAKAAAEAADADAAKKAAEAAASAAAAAASEAEAAKKAADAAAAQAAAQAAQAAAEKAKADAEAAKAAAEKAAADADIDAAAAAAAKAAAEEAQAKAVAAQKAAEEAQKAAEAADAEAAAAAADAAISAAAAAKQAADAAKSAAESAASADEAKAAQAAAEAAKADAEAAKAAAEAAKKAAEDAASEAGLDRDAAEAAKAAAELAQSRAEVAQKAAEQAQAAAQAANAEAAANAAKTAADAAKTASDAAEAAKAQAAAQAAQARAEAAQAAAEAARAKADEAAAKGEAFADDAKDAADAAERAEAAAEAAKQAAAISADAAAKSDASAAAAAAQAAKDAAAVADALKEVAAAKAEIAADKEEAAKILEAVKAAELGAAKYYALTVLAQAAGEAEEKKPDVVAAASAAIEAAADKAAVDAALADALAALNVKHEDVCPSKDFTDVPGKDNWAHAGIDYCVANSLMNGTSANIFSPNGIVTRAQLVTILYRVAGEPATEFKGTFADVVDGKFYSAAVEWAAANGVVTGKTETKFAPDDAITREQIAAILYRYAGKPEAKGNLAVFPDANDVSAYAVDAMAWAVGEDLINGIASGESTRLAPKNNATRAQIATIIMRFLED